MLALIIYCSTVINGNEERKKEIKKERKKEGKKERRKERKKERKKEGKKERKKEGKKERKKEGKKERKIDFFSSGTNDVLYQFNGPKMYVGNKSFLSFSKKDFQSTTLLIFSLEYHVAVAQRISSSRWCLRSQDRSYPVLALTFFSCSISPENSGSVKNRWCVYLPRSHTGNIFQSWTVVVRRHHVYVREFHHPSCNSVESAEALITE